MLPDITSEKSSTKSFLDQLIEQIDLNLLKISHLHYLLYRVFLTSLGFNAVYNFAGDLANDSKVIKDQRTYIVMSIGLSNIFGRLIIGYLGDQKWEQCVMRFARPFIWSHIICGGLTVLSGVILYAIPFLQRKKSNDNQIETDIDTIHSKKDLSSQEQQQKN
ncbi:unnamed protein product [Rotaria sp. Silwood1]|nr:unnamed protein product [Rotaria sp. Silwood1]